MLLLFSVQRLDILRGSYEHRVAADFSMFSRTESHLLLDDWSTALRLPQSPAEFELTFFDAIDADSSASGSQFSKFLLLIILLAYAGQGIGLIVACGIASRMLAMIVTVS